MSRPIFVTNEAEVNVLNVLKAFSADVTYHLFKNAVVVSDTTVLADLTEADFGSYAAVAVPWGTVGDVDDGFAGIQGGKASDGLQFAVFAGNSGADQTVYGCYATIDDGGGAKLLWAGNVFDADPNVVLNGRVVSGLSDVVIIVARHYLWDYFQFDFVGYRRFLMWLEDPGVGWPGSTTLRVAAVDIQNNIDTTYAGTPVITCDNSDFVVGSPATTTPWVVNFDVTFLASGQYTITATDTITPAIKAVLGYSP